MREYVIRRKRRAESAIKIGRNVGILDMTVWHEGVSRDTEF